VLAEVLRRASTEDGLWERCAAGVKPPASRDAMVAGFLDLYRNGAPAIADAA
jgi:hypothetical protein